MRYAGGIVYCERCRRDTPRVKSGECTKCRARSRRAARRAKASSRGNPLVRYGDLLKVADDLWSVWVRAFHPDCEMCRRPMPPDRRQCAHGWSRTIRATRFLANNTFSLCASCHRRHTPPGPAWFAWMRQKLGMVQFLLLELTAGAHGKLPLDELHLVILDAQQRIAALPESERKAWAIERAEKIAERLVRLGVRAA